jgi:hypothetical protein
MPTWWEWVGRRPRGRSRIVNREGLTNVCAITESEARAANKGNGWGHQLVGGWSQMVCCPPQHGNMCPCWTQKDDSVSNLWVVIQVKLAAGRSRDQGYGCWVWQSPQYGLPQRVKANRTLVIHLPGGPTPQRVCHPLSSNPNTVGHQDPPPSCPLYPNMPA